ncbi:hypothetical protein ACH5RR_005072 [Cinchona calisaya]|uniref:Non-specific lipid-transfer protein n=1 Tax=Cinchona calisaya TaxID=153742 RepID=A0ABD3AZJ6_9GENT
MAMGLRVVVAAAAVMLVMLVMLVVGRFDADAVVTSCGQVVRDLLPCVGYLKNGGLVSGSCCGGVRKLKADAKTTADRQRACRCLKGASAGIKVGNAQSLPGKCGVSIPYKISPSIDCSKVK